MKYKELVVPSLKELFEREIMEMLFSGALKIGDRLPPERELARQMRISQTVVHTGILELTSMGLLEVVPRKGTFVADYLTNGSLQTLEPLITYHVAKFDADTWETFLSVRACMERDFVRLAARNRTDDDVEKMTSQLQVLCETETIQEETEALFTLEHIIASATGNIIYPLFFNSFKPIYLSMAKTVRAAGGNRDYIAVYQEIVSLIEQRDEEASSRRALDVVDWCRRYIEV